MNPAPDSERPAETSDPLLEALRQRLGPGFGHEPPPAVWAGIRQQLPAASARPWWRRPRRLLPLLLLLLFGLLTAGWLAGPHLRERMGHAGASATKQLAGRPATSAPRGAATSTGLLNPKMLASSPSGLARMAAPRPAAKPSAAVAKSSSQPAAFTRSNLVTSKAATARLSTTQRSQLKQERRRKQGSLSATLPLTANWRSTTASRSAATRAQPASAEGEIAAVSEPLRASGPAHTKRRRAASAQGASRLGALGQPQPTSTAEHLADASMSIRRRGLGRRRPEASLPDLVTATNPDTAAGGPELLAGRAALLPLPGRPELPTPLVADTIWRGPVAAPRWSVLLLAGPTLSYRTTGSNPLVSQPVYATTPTSTAPTYNNALYNTSSTSLLERPALGWGAQVQVRRVLSGRWALALGLGYQEYATQLTLQPSSTAPSAAAQTRHFRDTYRLLTAPVQLGYALGPPRGRLALGLLAGAEPGWYRGGRSTEASSCNCEQQQFSQAEGSPYNAWTVALSLGLDLRYQLGGSASRWQLLVQPTGRYVATPLVRADASAEYLRRQPYSLGLLTGVAWSWR